MLLSNKLCLGLLIALTAFVRAAPPNTCEIGKLNK